MTTMRSIALAGLLIDTQNPRLESILEGQNDALRTIAATQDRKLLILARDIVANGLNPMEFPLVMPAAENEERYVVLEGNRRVAALKILGSPEIVRGAVDEATHESFRRLSTEYRNTPVESVECVVVSSRDEADHWIELRHTGENKGAGTVAWGAPEIERFKKRRRGLESPHLQILETLEEKGIISPETRRKVPITNLRRLIRTPYVRERLGIEIQDGDVVTRLPEPEVVRGLKRVVEDLASGRVKVPDIYYERDRRRYVDSMGEDLPDISKALPESSALGEAPKEKRPPVPARGVKVRPSQRKRATLIPVRGFSFSIDQPRINVIHHELRGLKVEDYVNAVAVLFRVFLELSVDAYIARGGLQVDPTAKLSHRMQEVANDLKAQGILDDQQLKPVRRAAQRDSFLGATLTTMNQYVHNQHFHPMPSDLLATWDSLEPFFVAIWARGE